MKTEAPNHKAPGDEITPLEFAQMLPDEDSARRWFEAIAWPDGRTCPNCGSGDTYEARHATMPYRCRACKRYFSVKTGTVMEGSAVPLLKWAHAMYLDVTSKGGHVVAAAS